LGSDPTGAGGKLANDQTKIGNTNTQIIDDKVTAAIGDALKNTVGVKLNGKTGLEVGRTIRYNVDESDDKVKEAKDNGGSALLFKRAFLGKPPMVGTPLASATQSITVDPKNGNLFNGEGTARGALTEGGGRGEFAAAIVNEPVTFKSDSSTLDPSVIFTLQHDLMLQVSAPGELSEAVFEIMKNDITALDFALKVTYGTGTASETIVPLAGDTTLLGTSVANYLNQVVLPYLHFDDTTHSLTVIDDVVLYKFDVPGDGTPATATFDYVGLASGAEAPEPSAWVALLSLGSLVAIRRALGCGKYHAYQTSS
jgi:hypothetical protein